MKRFRAFLVLDLFNAVKGTQKNMNSLASGLTPLVSARKMDNGYKDFVFSASKEIFAGHCLTLNNDGDGGAGIAYYQPSVFALDTHVTALYPKRNLSRFQLLYISNCISKQRILFGHGHSINSSRLEHLCCMLPVTTDGQPDYDFMEQYMKAIEKKLLTRYQSYLAQMRPHSSDINKINGGKIEWKTFKVDDLFDIKRPSARNKDDYQIGNVCFVASGAANNGVMKCCKPRAGEILDKGNCLTVSPVDGTCFYQPVDFLGRGGAGSSILLLYHKNITLNQNIGLFLSRALNVATLQYSYGRMANADSIRKTLFFLPVTPSGQPDYSYMESYMKDQETKLIERYVKYRLYSKFQPM